MRADSDPPALKPAPEQTRRTPRLGIGPASTTPAAPPSLAPSPTFGTGRTLSARRPSSRLKSRLPPGPHPPDDSQTYFSLETDTALTALTTPGPSAGHWRGDGHRTHPFSGGCGPAQRLRTQPRWALWQPTAAREGGSAAQRRRRGVEVATCSGSSRPGRRWAG